MPQHEFSRLAVVNRGEPAMRLIHAVRELNQGRDDPVRLIALHDEADRDSMFVRQADESVCLVPSAGPDDGRGGAAYLDYEALQRALKVSRADAVWVGWGPMSESPEFAELCERLGIVFIGPDPGVIRLLGDKIATKRLAERVGVPVVPWSDGPVTTAEQALAQAERLGFPLMIKPAAGREGRGLRRVDEPRALDAAVAEVRAEALQRFGDGTILFEKLVTGARHVEVQIVADGDRNAWALGVRDCSCQRRHQKVLEESSSPALGTDQEREIMDAARRLASGAGYRNTGTVEFLYEPEARRFWFIEMSPRLDVEHPVTEAVTGLDLVKLQLHVAAGGRLEGNPPAPSGHAIEARVCAEDPALGFVPAPGQLVHLRLPTGPGVRVDTGVDEGDQIRAELDPLVAKVIVWGRDRLEALARLRRALADTVVVLDGGTTNHGFLLELVARPEIRAAEIDTGWLDRLYLSGGTVPVRHGDLAVLQAAIELADRDAADDRGRFYALARRGRPQASAPLSRNYELSHRGQSYRTVVSQIAPDRYRITVDGQSVELGARRTGAHERRLELPGRTHRTLTSSQGEDLVVEVDGVPHRVSRDEGGIVRGPGPGLVVSIPVASGDIVEAGDVVAVLEAMKMESSLTAPFRGRVKHVFVGENVHVAAQAPLVALEQLDERPQGPRGERLTFAHLEAQGDAGPDPCQENLRRMEWLALGYDIGAGDVRRVIADLHGQCGDLLACDPALIPGEHRLLGMFADLRAVSSPQRGEQEPGPGPPRSPQEHLHAWLRSLDAEAEGLPPGFTAALRRALAHYGIDSLERTPRLEAACYRLFLSGQRAEIARAAIVAILDRRLEDADGLVGNVGEEFREVLDRLAVALEGRDPVVADLAREVRFRYFDEPLIGEARERVYVEMERHVAALTDDPKRADAAHRLTEIVESPRPLAPRLTVAMGSAAAGARRLLVEAMARRYYRTRSLERFEHVRLDGHDVALARYRSAGIRRQLGAAYVELEDIAAVTDAFARRVATLPAGELAVLDVYAQHRRAAPEREELAARLQASLAAVPTPAALHRIVVAVAEPRRGRGMGAIDLFTFRVGPEGLREDLVLRGLHPMMADRLQLWRLREFKLERLPSGEDIYLFQGIARANPKDRRLFALAEVRDLTSVRDERGRLVALPESNGRLCRCSRRSAAFRLAGRCTSA